MTYRTVEEQLERVLAAVRRHPSISVPLAEARGLTLRAPARATSAVPVFDNSAMDGFAVRFADVADATPEHPVVLQVIADIPAGSAIDPAIGAGEAARIMTGSPVSSDADAIVPFEDTVGGLADSLATATVQNAPKAVGAHIRRAADDIDIDDIVLDAGTLLGPRQLGALASAGIARVDVAPRARVVVVSTGSELVAPGTPLQRGQIPESNSILLAGLVAEAGADVVLRRVIDDDGDGPAEVVAEARELQADAVVFSGGVSAGAYEIVKQSLGDTMEFSKVGMQPGKPQGFGVTADGMLLFGLPGNPVSAAVSFEVFVRPALLRMHGRGSVHRARVVVPAAVGWRTPPGRRQYLPAVIDRTDPARPVVRPATAGGSGSHLSVGLGVAEAYAIVPAETEQVFVGDLIEVMELQ
ncbi:Molybdopterin biosynthesis protein MoeA [Microbacterium esteraromaticum]|uniref:Molybdopterin molybdenumtransferase n=1 Tax=Microbacterium esteraromaticum TaxID=57043 RepID=A0A1R4KQD9_9MICO|nr:gephyrin-like molybdotransferase Glp [Microbacterium esteraromaticum]SJN46492.1 Molybdopterin biosynthesis protein MoeA [Microbacterium esteraromaticum]